MVTSALITAASTGLFLLFFWLTRIVATARRGMMTVRHALKSMQDPELDELAREHAIQAAAIRLVVMSGSLISRSILALSAASFPVFAAAWTGLAPVSRTLAFMERWDVILIVTAAVVGGHVISVRLWPR